MSSDNVSEAAKAVVRRNTEEAQGGGDWALCDELFCDGFVDHTPQPGRTPDKAGALELCQTLRAAFPGFHTVSRRQAARDDLVTTDRTYHGTHQGEFSDIAPTGREVQFETGDALRVVDDPITEHRGVADLFSLMEQLGAHPAVP
jgi:predicted ester cyclase